MDNEMIAIAAVQAAISKTDYLTPYINSNDKEPSWDGFIYAYHHAGRNHPKSDLAGRVAVQVKGHLAKRPYPKEAAFPVEKTDLQNYLNDGGIIFFVVYFDEDGEAEKIYYKNLLPFELKRLLKDAKETKTIHLKHFPAKKADKANILLNFVRDQKKQQAAISAEPVSLKEILKSGKIPEISFGFTDVNADKKSPFDYLFGHGGYLYVNIGHGLQLPIDHMDQMEMFGTEYNADVMVGTRKHYDACKIWFKPGHIAELQFGRSNTFIEYMDEHRQTYNFKLKGTLSERIRDLEFIIDAFENGGFQIGDRVIATSDASWEELQSFNIPACKELLESFRGAKNALDRMDVRKDLNVDEMTDVDFRHLNMLIASVCGNKPVPLNDVGQSVGCFTIANLKLLIAVKKDSNGCRIRNFYEEPLNLKSQDAQGVIWDCPSFALLDKKSLLECCNICSEKIIKELSGMAFTTEVSSKTTLFLLEVLLAYDESTSDKAFFIDLAEKLSSIIREKDNDTPQAVVRINELQIAKRQRELTIPEKYELMQFVKDEAESPDIMTAAALLLDEQSEAEVAFEKIPQRRQEEFVKFPIYKYWRNERSEQALPSNES